MKIQSSSISMSSTHLEKSFQFMEHATIEGRASDDLEGVILSLSKEAEDGSFILVYLGDGGASAHSLELTWLRDWDRPYNLGDNEFHLAFEVEDYEAAHKLHEEMGCICFENEKMGIYFIIDPDNYWLEILPANR